MSETLTAHDLSTAGFCMFGLHQMRLEQEPWPTVTHDVWYVEAPAAGTFQACASCAAAHEQHGAEAHRIGRGQA